MAAARAATREAAALRAAARRPLPDGDDLEDALLQPPPPAPGRLNIGKLPEYWPHSPAAWFAFVEAKFRRAGLTQEAAMFDEVAGALTQDAIVLALDLLETPPAAQPYDMLKRRCLLLSRLLCSRWRSSLPHRRWATEPPLNFSPP
jgi:hypothetical protein